jgi:hypothetical protein
MIKNSINGHCRDLHGRQIIVHQLNNSDYTASVEITGFFRDERNEVFLGITECVALANLLYACAEAKALRDENRRLRDIVEKLKPSHSFTEWWLEKPVEWEYDGNRLVAKFGIWEIAITTPFRGLWNATAHNGSYWVEPENEPSIKEAIRSVCTYIGFGKSLAELLIERLPAEYQEGSQ